MEQPHKESKELTRMMTIEPASGVVRLCEQWHKCGSCSLHAGLCRGQGPSSLWLGDIIVKFNGKPQHRPGVVDVSAVASDARQGVGGRDEARLDRAMTTDQIALEDEISKTKSPRFSATEACFSVPPWRTFAAWNARKSVIWESLGSFVA